MNIDVHNRNGDLKTRRKQFLLIRVSRTDYEYYNADPKTGLREDTFNGI